MSSYTLTHPTAGAGGTPLVLTLPHDLIWTDEFAWQKVEQVTEYSSTGALLIDEWVRQAGRPITLTGSVDYAWCQRPALQTLNAWAQQPGLVLSLSINGTAHSVTWNHQEAAITADPVVPYSDPQPEDWYSLVLRFLEL